MKKFHKTIFLFVLSFAFFACEKNIKEEFSEATKLDSLKQTDFVITLENPIKTNKNIIYAPAFLFAWDKIKEVLSAKIIENQANSVDFKLLNRSFSHQNSLETTEYSATSEVNDGVIVAKASFTKNLPFQIKLQKLDNLIVFDKTKVSAFGMQIYDHEIAIFTHILYYKNDHCLVLKLSPKDENHEIILVKGLKKYQTLKDALQLTNKMIDLGTQEVKKSKLVWKYQLLSDDMFAIPSVKFDIETQYKNIEGQSFVTNDHKKYWIETAYQRTAFMLNEDGAKVESEGDIVAVADSISAEPVIIHPKKMIFDEDFLIIVKRTNKINPYFVMKVNNAELLMKQ